MILAYRIGRNTLAGTALTALLVLAAWRLIVWRIGVVYISDSNTNPKESS